jgi:hypothetical protein
MSLVKCPEFTFPPFGLRVVGISFFASIKDSPYGMKLSVLPQEVISAQHLGRKIPYSHS